MADVIEAVGLVKCFPADGAPVRAVDGIDLQVAEGESVSVMGPSGCGKSTLLHLLGGLDRPDSGRISIAGHPTGGLSEAGWARLRRRHVAFVFQSFHLIDELTAVENVELPALLIGASRPVARRRAVQLLDMLAIPERASHLPHRLSGGQQQRVAVARALVNEPELVLADEPTGSLDSTATAGLLPLLHGIPASNRGLVIVTHDPRVATTADRLMGMRDGRFVDQTRLTGGAAHALAQLTDLGG